MDKKSKVGEEKSSGSSSGSDVSSNSKQVEEEVKADEIGTPLMKTAKDFTEAVGEAVWNLGDHLKS